MANGGADNERFEAHVRALARTLPYPATPEIARKPHAPAPTRARLSPRFGWAIIVLVIVISLLAVPQVRAAIIEFFQIGGVRIYLAPTPTVTRLPSGGQPQPTITPRASAAPPTPTPTYLPSLLDLAGETTFDNAVAEADFTLRLPPAYGAPDRVFLQNFNSHGQLIILVWLDAADPNRIRLSLHAMMCGMCIEKNEPKLIETTTVNGQVALWVEGPYLVRLTNSDMDFRRLIEGHVLIWEVAGVTYRLETDLPLTEAVTIAESLK